MSKSTGTRKGRHGNGPHQNGVAAAVKPEQYKKALEHTDIVELPEHAPVRRTAVAFLAAHQKFGGNEEAARKKAIFVLGKQMTEGSYGPVNANQLMDGIKLAKRLLQTAA